METRQESNDFKIYKVCHCFHNRWRYFKNQPDTLILTCEFDPLRDEGEAYGKRLKEAGNYVEIHRIKDALHGYFALGIKQLHVQESFTYINEFLKEETL